MKKYAVLPLLLVCCLLTAPAFADEVSEAKDVLKDSVDKILAVLEDPKYDDHSKADEQLKELREIVYDIFDFEELSMRAVGVHWKRFEPEQRKTFAQAFADLLEATYTDRIHSYSENNEVRFTGGRQGNPGKVEIQTVLVADNKQIPIYYRLTKKDSWKVYDVIIEGVSLVKNYRSQFQEYLADHDPNELIELVQKKAEEKRQSTKERVSQS